MTDMFALQPTHNPHRWYLPVTEDLCVGPPDRTFMFGGIGLAAGIAALERTTGRPAIWATAHYLSFARPGATVDYDVWVPAEGRLTSQANVLAHVDDRQIITVHAALGSRADPARNQWVAMPAVPGPQECREAATWPNAFQGLIPRFETRLVHGSFDEGRTPMVQDDGRTIFWIRAKEGLPADSRLLAVIADFASAGMSSAIGCRAGGTSLDNTIRFGKIVPSEWVLCDVRIEMRHDGFVHCAMHLFADDGTLMAIASQSLIVHLHQSPRGQA